MKEYKNDNIANFVLRENSITPAQMIDHWRLIRFVQTVILFTIIRFWNKIIIDQSNFWAFLLPIAL